MFNLDIAFNLWFILTGQQKRKADFVYDDDEEDDYDLDDSFLNDDSSDDYDPTDSETDDDFSQPDSVVEDDAKRTLKEAKKFINKK